MSSSLRAPFAALALLGAIADVAPASSAPAAPGASALVSVAPSRATGLRRREAHLVSSPVRPIAVAHSRGHGRFHLIGASAGATGVALVTLTLDGEVTRTVTLGAARAGRALAFDAHLGRLLLLDRDGALWAIPTDASGELAPARAARITAPIGLGAVATALAVDGAGAIVALDGAGRRLLEWRPGGVDMRAIDLVSLGIVAPRGIAVDAVTGNVLVVDAAARRIYELTRDGVLVARHDVAKLGLASPGALAVAPSRDATDDPAIRSLYVVDGVDGTGGGQVVELAWNAPPAFVASTTQTATLVRTIPTSEFSPPSPDPSGIGYDAARNRLVIVDGEVDEMAIFAGSNVFETSLAGTLQATGRTTAYSHEPTGVTIDANRGWRYLTDDDQKRVHTVRPGADARFGTADDVLSSFSTTAFGCGDPEGVAHDPVANRLFLADGVGEEVWILTAGANGVFDGVAPGGDDQVTHFDTTVLGVLDPETVEWNAGAGTLLLLGRTNPKVVEVDLTGRPLSETDLSFAPLDNPAGLARAPASSTPGAWSWYIVNRAVDNDSSPNENDGTLLEIGFASAPPPPPSGGLEYRVAASADDAEESATGSVSLTSSDLELTFDGSQQRVGLRFTGVAIPRGATIATAWIQFGADEAHTEATALTIQGQASDDPPAFAGTPGNVSTRPRTSASIAWSPPAWPAAGIIGPDQRTPDLAPVIREIVGRPGWSSGNALAIVITGTGRRTAYAYDGQPARAALLHVELGATPANAAPVVDAGPDRSITLPASAALDGSVTDDGLPNPPGALSFLWSVASGPGTVTFANSNALDTQASFGAAGVYVLRLTANDGALVASDVVTVTAAAPPITNHAPVVDAGPDQTVTLPAGVALDGTASDDGLPVPPGALSFAWSVDSGPGAVTFASPDALDTPASFGAAGVYVLRLTASDGALATSDVVTVTVLPAITTIEKRVAAGSDDAEEAVLVVTLASKELQLVDDVVTQAVGLRFRGLNVPRNATILRAWVQFRAAQVDADPASLVVRGQAADDAPTFAIVPGNVSARPTTAAAVDWSPAPWTTVGEAGAAQRTPDLAAIVQEIVRRPGWAGGNAIVVTIGGAGRRTAHAYEAKRNQAPVLHLEYRP